MRPTASRRMRVALLSLGLAALASGSILAGEASVRARQVQRAADAKAEEARREGSDWVASLEHVASGRQLARFDERRHLLEAFTQARRQRALGVLLAVFGLLTAAGAWAAGRIEHGLAELDSASG